MKNKYPKRSVPLLLALPVILIGVLVWQIGRLRNQERLNFALITAIKTDDMQDALVLLREGADPNAKDIHLGSRTIWQWLWNRLRGQPVNPTANPPTTLLILLQPVVYDADYIGQKIPPIHEENPELVMALLTRGADVNVRDVEGNTPLLLAAKDNMHPTIMLLLAKHADVNVLDKNGYSALRIAIEHSDTPAVQQMVDQGAQIDSIDFYGRTPLLAAVEFQNLSVVRMLLARGADAKHRDQDGNTVLHICAGAPVGDPEHADLRYDILRLLLDRGVDINAQDTKGETALLIASEQRDTETIKMLLEKGADVHIKDHAGRTPLQIAQDHQDSESIHLLKQVSSR
jgi:ankyrin repeat protein